MSGRCPTCGQAWPGNDPIATLEAQLRGTCEARGIPVSWDGWIAEKHAAALARRSPRTLANRRGLDRPLRSRKVGRAVEVELRDLARWLSENTEFL